MSKIQVAPSGKAPLKCGKGILMLKLHKAVISVFLVLAVAAAFCGCSPDRSDEAKSLCVTFCEDVKAGNTEKLLTYFNYDEISENELNEIISRSGLNNEEASFYQDIRETVDYASSEPVYDKESKTCSVQVNWSFGDYLSDQALMAQSEPEFKAAINSVPAKTVSVDVKVDLSGEFARIMNPKDVIEAAYSFNNADSGVMPGLLSDYFIDGTWVLAPKGTYLNTDSIGLRINFDKSLSDYRFVPGIVYTIARGDEVLYSSDVVYLENNTLRMDLNAEMAGSSGLNEDGFLVAGKYTVMVFDEHFNDICSYNCEVMNESLEKEIIEIKEYKKDYYLSNLVYEFKDSDLMANSFVYKSGWWDYDGTSVGKSAFASNTKTLGFSLAVSDTNEAELYYDYYFCEKPDFKDINETEPVYSSSCKPSLYQDQACYDLDFTPDEMKHGFYGLVVYSDPSRKHIVFTAACIVVEETSQDVLN